MNKNINKLSFFVLSTLLVAILMSTSVFANAQENDFMSKESLYSLDGSSLVKTLESNGLVMPADYEQHRDMAQSFVSKYVPLLLEGKVNPHVPSFNYDQSNQMMLELTRVLTKMNLLEVESNTRYSLQNSTAIGSWSDSYPNYNCYAYSLGRTYGLQPGTTSNTPFSLTLSISQMADVVLADLDSMGYWGYKTTTKPTNRPDQWFRVICIRKDNGNEDYHFMKSTSSLSSWLHKPGGTQPLSWNYSSPGFTVWSSEHVYMGTAYPGNVTYESQIYYILYKGKNDPGIQPYNLNESQANND